MSYALSTLWHERQRFLPAVLAVAFSALLIALQCGLLLGLFSITSIPIDNSSADIWIAHPKVPSVDLGNTIPESWMSYAAYPEVAQTEPYMEGFAYWDKPNGGRELCVVIGTRLDKNSLGVLKQLTERQRDQLSELGNVIIDRGEFDRMGITKVGDTAEVIGRRVYVVSTVTGFRSLAGPYCFCSIDTAKMLLRSTPDQATFLLAKCHDPADAKKVVDRINAYQQMIAYDGKVKIEAFTAEEFSFKSRWHWLTKTKAGIALGLAAMLGLMVGMVVTYQTLKAATLASLREYAVLRALGIPRWRMSLTVLAQSFWVGVTGIALAMPAVYLLAYVGTEVGAKVLLPWQLMVMAVSVTMTMALISGLLALRALRQVEPVTLLR